MNVPARCTAIVLSAIVAIVAAGEAAGASRTWQVSSGNWSTASNWSGALLPTASDTAYIASGDTATINSTQPGATSGTLSLGSSSAGSGSVLMTSGSLSTITYEYVGDSGIGNFTQPGGSNSIPTAGFLYLGNSPGSSGTYALSASGLLSTANENIGNYGTGGFLQSGGTNMLSSYLELGLNPSSSGSYTLSSSGLLSAHNEIVGFSGSGSFTQLGGINSVSKELDIGYYTDTSSYNLSAGSLFSTRNEVIGVSGTGSFTQSGGTNTVAGELVLGEFDGSSGTYNLNGGLLVLSAAGMAQGDPSATFNFSGGTLLGGTGFSSSVSIALSTAGSDAVFDIAGGTTTLSGTLSGPGGLIKSGAGLLILNASNDYGGDTAVSAGTLEFSTALALPAGSSLTVGANAKAIFPALAQGVALAGGVQAVPEPSTLALLSAAPLA